MAKKNDNQKQSDLGIFLYLLQFDEIFQERNIIFWKFTIGETNEKWGNFDNGVYFVRTSGSAKKLRWYQNNEIVVLYSISNEISNYFYRTTGAIKVTPIIKFTTFYGIHKQFQIEGEARVISIFVTICTHNTHTHGARTKKYNENVSSREREDVGTKRN